MALRQAFDRIDSEDCAKRQADWLKLRELLWQQKPSNAPAAKKLAAALGIDRAQLDKWDEQIEKILSLQPLIDELPKREAAKAEVDGKLDDYHFRKKQAMAAFDREWKEIEPLVRDANGMVNQSKDAINQDAQLRKEFDLNFGDIDMQNALKAAVNRRRSIRQTIFGGPREGDCPNIDIEQWMMSPSGIPVPKREDQVLLEGQSEADGDYLNALAVAVAADGRPGRYLLSPADAARVKCNSDLVWCCNPTESKKGAKSAGSTSFAFDFSMNVETGQHDFQFILAPDQKTEELAVMVEWLDKGFRKWFAAIKALDWRSPAALDSERFGGAHHRPLADRAAPMSERPT